MYRTISPTKIKNRRGEQTRKAVVERIGFVISEQELFSYEKGDYKPSQKKLPYLLQALDCTFDDISEPYELAVPV